ncbi:MAG: HDOD domain-containing protein [Planctomycetes bacterium]|nr:HDOD domain-containing protein [Planctomycetota bacterium]
MSTLRAKQLIRDNLNIPTLPAIVERISTLMADPEVGTAEVGEVVGQDAPLAAKVLRIANSAYYGLRERCLSTEQASSVLGLRVLKNVVTQASVIQQFEHLRGFAGFDIDQLWHHSILTATACAELAKHCTGRVLLDPEEFYVCGLLHDLGKVVMLDAMGESYLEAFLEAARSGERLHVVEERRFGFNHTDVGSLVATRWQLPVAAASAIQFHHGPRENVQQDPVVALVANANLLAHRVAEGRLEEAAATLDAETAGFLGLDPARVPEIVAAVKAAQGAIAV